MPKSLPWSRLKISNAKDLSIGHSCRASDSLAAWYTGRRQGSYVVKITALGDLAKSAISSHANLEKRILVGLYPLAKGPIISGGWNLLCLAALLYEQRSSSRSVTTRLSM